MRFNRHSDLVGNHAFLSPSKPAWIRYDQDKMDRVYDAYLAAQRGTELHELAQRLIAAGVKLPDVGKTLNDYVNDAIGFRMSPEVTFYYSENAYGHADAAGFRDQCLRIHDLKTGFIEVTFDQLMIYGALFCLEYRYKPSEIQIELRVYQNDQVKVYIPDEHEIVLIMEKIVSFDRRIKELRKEVL